MANPAQLATLRQGVMVWNQWVMANPKIKADLGGANLSGTDLKNADLRDADLQGADLRGANLYGVNLTGAWLMEADLSGANLCGTPMRPSPTPANSEGKRAWYIFLPHRFKVPQDPEPSDPGIPRENVFDAFPSGANLTGAILRRTTLTEAHFGFTVFGGTDIREARDLETCIHHAVSALDIQTILRSEKLPPVFLRGCGLPERLIDFLPSLLNDPIQFYSCFISYSTKDLEFADRLRADLQNNGVRCYLASKNVEAGKKLHEQIDEAIRFHDRLLLILSEYSMNSEWVKTEIALARKKERNEQRRVLFPVRLVPFEQIQEWTCFDADAGKDSAREIREYFVPDFSNWKDQASYQQAFAKLLENLKAKEQRRE